MKYVLVAYFLLGGEPASITVQDNLTEQECVMMAVKLSKQEWLEVAPGVEVSGVKFQCE